MTLAFWIVGGLILEVAAAVATFKALAPAAHEDDSDVGAMIFCSIFFWWIALPVGAVAYGVLAAKAAHALRHAKQQPLKSGMENGLYE